MSHSLDCVGGCRESEFRVDAVGSIMMDVSEKLAHRHAHLACGQWLAHSGLQASEGYLKERTIREFQRLASQMVQSLSDFPSSQGLLVAAAAPLKLTDEVEMTELEDPAVLAGERFHASKVVGYHSLDAAFGRGWDGLKDLLPDLNILAAIEKQGIQEHGVIFGAGFQCHQIQYPGEAAEAKPQAVDQEHQVSCRIVVAARLSDKVKQSFAKAVTEGLRCGGSAQEHPKSPLGQEDSIQKVQTDSAMWATSSLLPNPPSSSTTAALPPPQTVRVNCRTTTGGFRMHGFHAYELSA